MFYRVAPHTGAWIETVFHGFCTIMDLSHPTRVRGLKRLACGNTLRKYCVAPHTGAWIETSVDEKNRAFNSVAPHTGAWIETLSFK